MGPTEGIATINNAIQQAVTLIPGLFFPAAAGFHGLLDQDSGQSLATIRFGADFDAGYVAGSFPGEGKRRERIMPGERKRANRGRSYSVIIRGRG